MIDKNFIPPPPEISRAETEKRLALISWFKEEMRPYITALIVSGSMGSGQNYSVSPKSDIDMQLLYTRESLDALRGCPLFNESEISNAIAGATAGVFDQFSILLTINPESFQPDPKGISLECHFWEETAMLEAITYRRQNTHRLRSRIDTPSTDHAFAFDGTEDTQDFYGQMVAGFAVGDFHSYRIVDDKLYLCRPITNVLGGIAIQISHPRLESAIESCWEITKQKLADERKRLGPDSELSVVSALPSKWKMSAEAKNAVLKRSL